MVGKIINFKLLNRMNMKKIFRFLLIISLTISTVLFSSCRSDEDKDSYGLSKIVTYPVFSLTGGNFVVETAHAGSWTDPGAEAYAGEVKVNVISKGNVNTSVPGLYTISYTAFDESGLFSVSTERKVLITSVPLTADFYSGNYQIVSATRTNKLDVTCMGGETLGWYKSTDSWFQSAKIPVEFVDLGTELKVIPGNSNYGPFDGTVTFNKETNVLAFSLRFTSGTNAGLSWSTSWTKL